MLVSDLLDDIMLVSDLLDDDFQWMLYFPAVTKLFAF
jgi:hypothetical protein